MYLEDAFWTITLAKTSNLIRGTIRLGYYRFWLRNKELFKVVRKVPTLLLYRRVGTAIEEGWHLLLINEKWVDKKLIHMCSEHINAISKHWSAYLCLWIFTCIFFAHTTCNFENHVTPLSLNRFQRSRRQMKAENIDFLIMHKSLLNAQSFMVKSAAFLNMWFFFRLP